MGLIRVTEELLGLTGQRGVVDLHLVRFEQDGVSGDLEAALDLDNIARDKLTSLNVSPSATALDSGLGRDHVLKIVHERGGLGRLRVREHTGDEHDNGEHNTKVKIGLIGLIFLDTESNETEDGTEPKKEREEASLLLQEEDARVDLVLLGKLVLTVSCPFLGVLFIGETMLERSVELLLELFSAPEVIFLFKTKRCSIRTDLKVKAQFNFI